MEVTAAHTWSFEAIGTQWRIALYNKLRPRTLAHIKQVIAARIEAFDITYSRFRTDSLITHIFQKPGTFQFPDDSNELFMLYQTLYEVTDGAVTPLIGKALSDAGYDADYSLQPKKLQSPPLWDDVMTFRNGTLITHQPILLDFGAAGKGYLIDIIAALLVSNDITAFYIDGSGDMVCRGLNRPLSVGLEHPNDSSQVVGIVKLNNGSLCGSAGNRRAWQGYTHILDPHSLQSPHNFAAVWCIAESTLQADGLTTALYFSTPEQLKQHFEFEYCLMNPDGVVECSEAFKVALFNEEERVTV